MKKIGIVGGVAGPSTVIYYSELCRRGEQDHLARKSEGVFKEVQDRQDKAARDKARADM